MWIKKRVNEQKFVTCRYTYFVERHFEVCSEKEKKIIELLHTLPKLQKKLRTSVTYGTQKINQLTFHRIIIQDKYCYILVV